MKTELAAILGAIDFIENHLMESIQISDIADEVSFSVYHFSRTFQRFTHYSPYDYLMRRRMTEAVDRLIMSEDKIIDIGCLYQFNSPENFSRACKRLFRMQPRQIRERKQLDQRLLTTKLLEPYLIFINSIDPIKPKIRCIPELALGGFEIRIENGSFDQSFNDLLKLVEHSLEDQGMDFLIRELFGLNLWLPYRSDGFFLMGILLEEDEVVPEHFVVKTLSDMNYACFEVVGGVQSIRFTLEYIYRCWYQKTNINEYPKFELFHFCRKEQKPLNSIMEFEKSIIMLPFNIPVS